MPDGSMVMLRLPEKVCNQLSEGQPTVPVVEWYDQKWSPNEGRMYLTDAVYTEGVGDLRVRNLSIELTDGWVPRAQEWWFLRNRTDEVLRFDRSDIVRKGYGHGGLASLPALYPLRGAPDLELIAPMLDRDAEFRGLRYIPLFSCEDGKPRRPRGHSSSKSDIIRFGLAPSDADASAGRHAHQHVDFAAVLPVLPVDGGWQVDASRPGQIVYDVSFLGNVSHFEGVPVRFPNGEQAVLGTWTFIYDRQENRLFELSGPFGYPNPCDAARLNRAP